MISFFSHNAVDQLSRSLRIDPQAIRRARNAFYKKSLGISGALAELPPEARERFAKSITFHALSESRRFDSSIDGASKIISKTSVGYSIETVILRPTTGRTALCVSSQVGCAAACSFCATGQMGVAKDLTADEILDQVILANEMLLQEGRRVRNIVFMGMGEPMHNEEQLGSALERLQDPTAFNYPSSRILVSTVGVPDALLRTASRFPRINFALSLHSPDQVTRESIIPLAKRYSLADLRSCLIELNHLQSVRQPVMIEYLMLADINDTDSDAEQLAKWLTGLRVHINLIPYNRVEHAPDLHASPARRIGSFQAVLQSQGFATTVRYSLGRDIDAACGQLVRSENRVVARRHAERRRL